MHEALNPYTQAQRSHITFPPLKQPVVPSSFSIPPSGQLKVGSFHKALNDSPVSSRQRRNPVFGSLSLASQIVVLAVVGHFRHHTFSEPEELFAVVCLGAPFLVAMYGVTVYSAIRAFLRGEQMPALPTIGLLLGAATFAFLWMGGGPLHR